jgi:hypothetical protein
MSASEKGQIIVRMIFNALSKKMSSSKRINKGVSTSHRGNHIGAKTKRIRMPKKRNRRQINLQPHVSSTPPPVNTTDRDIRKSWISPNIEMTEKRKLLVDNSLCDTKDVNLRVESSTVKKQILPTTANIHKRYRNQHYVRCMENKRGLSRNKLGSIIKKWIDIGKKSRKRNQERNRKIDNVLCEWDDKKRQCSKS